MCVLIFCFFSKNQQRYCDSQGWWALHKTMNMFDKNIYSNHLSRRHVNRITVWRLIVRLPRKGCWISINLVNHWNQQIIDASKWALNIQKCQGEVQRLKRANPFYTLGLSCVKEYYNIADTTTLLWNKDQLEWKYGPIKIPAHGKTNNFLVNYYGPPSGYKIAGTNYPPWSTFPRYSLYQILDT